MTPTNPKPGDGYKILRVGSIIPPGAELKCHNGWIASCRIGRDYDKVDKAYGFIYRVPVPPVKQPKPINYQRLAKRMSLAPSIREARKIYNNSVKGKK